MDQTHEMCNHFTYLLLNSEFVFVSEHLNSDEAKFRRPEIQNDSSNYEVLIFQGRVHMLKMFAYRTC